MYPAGSMRPKSYGMEYRALSNQWVRFEESIDWIFEATITALDLLYDGKSVVDDFRKLGLIQHYDTSTLDYVNALFQSYGIPELPETLTEINYNGC